MFTQLQQGELITNYFATSHVSLGNYVSMVSGQESTPSQNNDCLNLASLSSPPLVGGFTNVSPGTDTTEPSSFPGQVVGDGCVLPAPTQSTHGARTIGDQLDENRGRDEDRWGEDRRHHDRTWRGYAEDMGSDLVRDYGMPDPLGGADCAHPPINGVDHSNSAGAADQYATRHNPFVYFHSVIDDAARCTSGTPPFRVCSPSVRTCSIARTATRAASADLKSDRWVRGLGCAPGPRRVAQYELQKHASIVRGAAQAMILQYE